MASIALQRGAHTACPAVDTPEALREASVGTAQTF